VKLDLASCEAITNSSSKATRKLQVKLRKALREAVVGFE